MFDVISYALDNEVSIEIIPMGPEEGFRIRMRDIRNAAQESLLVSQVEYLKATLPDVLIEQRCDRLLELIGKKKRSFTQYAEASARMREREAFFREPKDGKIS